MTTFLKSEAQNQKFSFLFLFILWKIFCRQDEFESERLSQYSFAFIPFNLIAQYMHNILLITNNLKISH